MPRRSSLHSDPSPPTRTRVPYRVCRVTQSGFCRPSTLASVAAALSPAPLPRRIRAAGGAGLSAEGTPRRVINTAGLPSAPGNNNPFQRHSHTFHSWIPARWCSSCAADGSQEPCSPRRGNEASEDRRAGIHPSRSGPGSVRTVPPAKGCCLTFQPLHGFLSHR